MADGATAERAAGRVGSKALIREINEALVLDVVRRRGTTSRAEITSSTGLSPATVTGITGQLVGEGLLLESDVLRGTGGRPARLLQLGRDAVVVAGVQLSPDAVEIALVDLRGDVVSTLQVPLSSTTPDTAADTVAAAVSSVIASHPGSELRGVSVALSGVVDRPRGIVRHSGALGWEDVPFAALLAGRLGRRVAIDSLVNSFTTGLLLLDTDLAERDVIVFSVGASLGASMLTRGRIHRGFRGGAGGFAHSAIGRRDGGALCHCGAHGCLETQSSVWGLRQALETRGIDPSDLVAPAASAVLGDGGAKLGLAIANASKMFGPERVVLVLAAEIGQTVFEEACREAFTAEYAFGDAVPPFLVTVPADGDIFARGAGYDMITELFSAEPVGGL
ncbi:ROK family transcriptional regulator [Microbacterium sp. LTA6]|uniref:ROK family protein n=1 Tax=Microbacterium sp. LTA6 TaxID=3129771 RepID=UPI003248DD59